MAQKIVNLFMNLYLLSSSVVVLLNFHDEILRGTSLLHGISVFIVFVCVIHKMRKHMQRIVKIFNLFRVSFFDFAHRGLLLGRPALLHRPVIYFGACQRQDTGG